MRFDEWAMDQCARSLAVCGRTDVKTVYALVKGRNPVKFYTGKPRENEWSTREEDAKTWPTQAEARGIAYGMQAHYQDTIHAEPVYRMANDRSDRSNEG
jgi:hypothetical protein